jgi:hypothetical protein
MVRTPASIEHDGAEKDSALRNRRLQRGSWPGGQGEEAFFQTVVAGVKTGQN